MMPEQADRPRRRTCVVTGATSGIGLETARALVRRGAHVLLAARAGAKADAALVALRREPGATDVDLLPLDLADLASVRACAGEIRRRVARLDLLINNAGIAGQRGLTKQGVEVNFGVNHLGHFLLTHLLLDRLCAGASSRVVTVSSHNHRWVKAVDLEGLGRPGSFAGLAEYCFSKLCNVLFTRELARRLAGTRVKTYAVHPGVVRTAIWGGIVPAPIEWLARGGMLTAEEGARTSIYCGTAPALANASGRYYEPIREAEPSTLARDAGLARRLWELSARLTGISADASAAAVSRIGLAS